MWSWGSSIIIPCRSIQFMEAMALPIGMTKEFWLAKRLLNFLKNKMPPQLFNIGKKRVPGATWTTDPKNIPTGHNISTFQFDNAAEDALEYSLCEDPVSF